MREVKVFSQLPDKSNIYYEVINADKSHNNKSIFMPVILELEKKGYDFERTIIFFRTRANLRPVYEMFFRHLGSMYSDYTNRPFARFHRDTQPEVKEFIIDSFSQADGTVRILLATMAFGMGVNCRGLNRVIQYGPSNTLEDYFQETGRIGRDGSEFRNNAHLPRMHKNKRLM